MKLQDQLDAALVEARAGNTEMLLPMIADVYVFCCGSGYDDCDGVRLLAESLRTVLEHSELDEAAVDCIVSVLEETRVDMTHDQAMDLVMRMVERGLSIGDARCLSPMTFLWQLE